MLPGIQGTIAQEIVKDTYDLNFITLQSGYNEEDLENALEQNITSFLLELGTGFAFVGRQKEIIVGNLIYTSRDYKQNKLNVVTVKHFLTRPGRKYKKCLPVKIYFTTIPILLLWMAS